MRDLTVHDLHAFCVVAGDTPVLVHSSNGLPCEVATNAANGPRLAKQLKEEEISSALGGHGQSVHGAERLVKRGFTGEDIVDILNGDAYAQSDGATAYVSSSAGKYNVIVIGGQGVVTALRGVSAKSVSALARNYGWEGYP